MNDYLIELDKEVSSAASSIPSSLSPTDHDYSNNNTTNIANSNNTLLPNFAQAALLLQNSSGVYSRKVEYLHTLVYEAFHKLIEQVNQNSKSSSSKQRSSLASKTKNNKKSVDEDIFNFQEYDPELDFLLLDDVLPIDNDGKKINMKQKEKSDGIIDLGGDNGGVLTEFTNSSSTGSDNNTTLLNATRLSIGAIIDDQSDGKGSASGLAGNGMNTMLRLMNGACQVHSGTGALLMPGTTATREMVATTMHSMSQHHGSDPGMVADENDGGIIPMDTSIEKEDAIMGSNNEMEENNGDEVVFDNHCDYDDNDDDDGGNGFVLNDEVHSVNEDNNQNDMPTNDREETPTTPEIQDPWKMMLDPHDNTKSKIKPMKFGKTIRLPVDCDEMPSDSVTGTRSKISKKRKKKSDSSTKIKEQKSNEEGKHEWWNKCIATHSYNAAIAFVKEEIIRRKTIERNKTVDDDDDDSDQEIDPVKTNRNSIMYPIPLNGHLFSNEFQYIAEEQKAQKALEKRKKTFRDNERGIDIVCDSAAAAITNERFRDMYEEGDHDYEEDDRDGFLDFDGGAEYGDDDGDDNEIDDNNQYNHFTPAHLGENATLRDFDKVFSNYDDNGSGNEQGTFEELCRAHLKEFAKGAAKYAVETELTKRVGSWQSKLAVILEEEESRHEFNIGTYSHRTIQAIRKGTEREKTHSSNKTVRIF